MPNPNKLTVNNIGYLYPSTRQREGDAGVVVRLYPDAIEPHVKLKPLEPIFDQAKVGDAGKPQTRKGTAIVKQIFPEIERALQHQEWPVREVTDGGWALAQDPWYGRWHWLPSRTERGDHLYAMDGYKVAMQGLTLEG